MHAHRPQASPANATNRLVRLLPDSLPAPPLRWHSGAPTG